METKVRYDDHCFHIRGYAILRQGVRLETAVNATLAWRVLKSLREAAGPSHPPHETLRAGQRGLTALGDSWRRDDLAARVKELVGQAEREAGSGSGADQLLRSIKRRAAEWQAGLAEERGVGETSREIARGFDAEEDESGNPYAYVVAHLATVERAGEIVREASARAREADTRAQALEDELVRDVERLRKQDERLSHLAQSEKQSDEMIPARVRKPLLKRWWPQVAVGAVGFVLAVILGVSAFWAAAFGIVAAVLSAFVQWRAGKSPAVSADGYNNAAVSTAGTGSSRRLATSLREKFLSYGLALEDAAILAAEEAFAARLLNEMRASTWHTRSTVMRAALDETEAALRQELDGIPEGFFHEVDPGNVELFGRELVEVLVESVLSPTVAENFSARVVTALTRMKGVTFAEGLRTGDGRMSARSLIKAVAEVHPGFMLEESLAWIERSPTGQRLFIHWLDELARVACSALALGQGMRLNPSLSVVRLTVGLPAGEADPLAKTLRQRMPHAGITLGSFPDAIEFVFDVRNLPAAALMTHELSRPHYRAANRWERERLWHFPHDANGGGDHARTADDIEEQEVTAQLNKAMTHALPRNGSSAAFGKTHEIIFPGDVT